MKRLKLRFTRRSKYAFSFLEKHIMFKFLLNAKCQFGTRQVRPYIIGIRRNISMYNIYYLISQIRTMLYMIHLHSYSKELVVILANNLNVHIGYRKFYQFACWAPGFLTNFKILMRRALAETRYKNISRLTKILAGALYVKRNPQLPTLAISLSTHSHWFLTEAHRLALPIFTNSEAHASHILPFNQKYLPINVMSCLIRETIFAAGLDDRIYFRKSIFKKRTKRLKKNLKKRK